jgi:hypothetical protein
MVQRQNDLLTFVRRIKTGRLIAHVAHETGMQHTSAHRWWSR